MHNNIFYRLPRGVEMEAGAEVVASTNNFHLMVEGGIVGDSVILTNPFLAETYNLAPYSPLIDASEIIPGVNEFQRKWGLEAHRR